LLALVIEGFSCSHIPSSIVSIALSPAAFFPSHKGRREVQSVGWVERKRNPSFS
jgi:hypothetical protein